MQLYLQSAVVERGVREDELRARGTRGRRRRGVRQPDRRASSSSPPAPRCTPTASTTSPPPPTPPARSTPFAGQYAEVLFGIGLLGASLLAAAILPIATSYVVSESLGYEKGVGRRREEAPVFVNIITAMIMISAFVAIIPGLPGDLAARRGAGGQRAAAADQPVLHLAPVALRARDGRASQPRPAQRRRRAHRRASPPRCRSRSSRSPCWGCRRGTTPRPAPTP